MSDVDDDGRTDFELLISKPGQICTAGVIVSRPHELANFTSIKFSLRISAIQYYSRVGKGDFGIVHHYLRRGGLDKRSFAESFSI